MLVLLLLRLVLPDNPPLTSCIDDIISEDHQPSISSSNYKSLSVLYTNADQFINKRDLLVQIANPYLILISEILPKAPNSIIHSALFAIPGYSSYLNFDPDCVSNIHGIGLFVSQNIHALQVIFNDASDYNEHVYGGCKAQILCLLAVFVVAPPNPSVIAYHHFVIY